MSTPIEESSHRGSALRLHRQLTAIWATGPGLQRLAAVNHSVIGVRFMATAFVFFLIGGVLGMLTRVQLATPQATFMDSETYNQVFTMHGSMMLFLFAIPVLEGIAVYLIRNSRHPRLRIPKADRVRLLVLPIRWHDPNLCPSRRCSS